MKGFLILDLEAPTVSFGSNTVDTIGRVGDFPTQSMVTGLIANALGYDRSQTGEHDILQTALRFGAVIVREGKRCMDYQTAEVFKSDKAWMTDGTVVAREMGDNGTTIRTREFDADKSVAVAVEFNGDAVVDVDELARRIMYPERPIFVGRKPNLPSSYVSAPGVIEAESMADALAQAAASLGASDRCRALLPADEAAAPRDRVETVSDCRNWHAGVHTGSRKVRLRYIQPTHTIGAAA